MKFRFFAFRVSSAMTMTMTLEGITKFYHEFAWSRAIVADRTWDGALGFQGSQRITQSAQNASTDVTNYNRPCGMCGIASDCV